MEQNLTAALLDLRPQLDEPAREKTRMLVADVLANQQLARSTEFGQLMTRLGEDRSPFGVAALAHSIELDDMHRVSATHPGSAVVGGALHLAGQHGHAGRALVDAVGFGVEVVARIAEALGGPALYQRGYHPSSYCAAFGVAAAGALLLDLPREQFAAALGLAGVQAAGLMCGVENGPFSWYVQYGRAAAAGLDAVRWAAAGVTAPRDVLGGSRGLLEVFGRPAGPLLEPGVRGIPQLSFKMHACLHFGQAAVEAALSAGADWRQVERVELGIPEQAYSVRSYDAYPDSRLGAQSNLPYLLAAALRFGRLTLAEFESAAMASPEVRELWGRVAISGRPDLSAMYPRYWPAEVTVRLRDGGAVTRQVVSALGDPERPPTWDQLAAKTGDREAMALGQQLDDLTDLRPLTGTPSPSAEGASFRPPSP